VVLKALQHSKRLVGSWPDVYLHQTKRAAEVSNDFE